ncbi:hypothetical protein M878_09505 [Streptomyces roseochromogenus subsp. oscitans DS 12.976]|uniref:Copper amine oxidase catalytic domain-containing protein n=1 Tax=Streptomyces roseochromogenus subsp. oscitans DS 12.976 TaxID=1352936 RepID=V6KTG8_STRRC|nr:hypothetical protein M878_09505 [Streptomyces roseochromogenus subsp. oscitans DS 12.976]
MPDLWGNAYSPSTTGYGDVTGEDFAQSLMNLSTAEGPGGTIKTVKVPDAVDPAHPNGNGLCTTRRSRGHAYRMHDAGTGRVYQAEGKDFLVYTVNQVGWYEYITEWRFRHDGTIAMNVGATGRPRTHHHVPRRTSAAHSPGTTSASPSTTRANCSPATTPSAVAGTRHPSTSGSADRP